MVGLDHIPVPWIPAIHAGMTIITNEFYAAHLRAFENTVGNPLFSKICTQPSFLRPSLAHRWVIPSSGAILPPANRFSRNRKEK